VSQALLCPEDEDRVIASIDMHGMNKIKWVNRANHTACIEAGIVGKDLEQQLKGTGMVLGHEPDSMEFSTLGGWVATRASGMRKNKYGNIEDIVVSLRMVTTQGTLEKSCQVPRMSSGPDVHEIALGSEGTLGIVTEVVVRLRPAPQQTVYGSMIFPSFAQGCAALHEIALARLQPVSIRLVDNEQFQFGLSLKPPQEDWKQNVVDKIKKWYVVQRLKFEPEQMVAATLLFEGTAAEIRAQETAVYSIAARHGGMKAGAENGIRGYFLTYMIAYMRDFGLGYQFLAESFETSCPHANVLALCEGVKKGIVASAKRHGVPREPFISCRVTQLYDTGVCIYFYFGFVWHGLADPVATFNKVEHDAREDILRYGGSISHHHGVGKLRKAWMRDSISPVGMQALQGIKKALDPQNIFGSQNLIDVPTTPASAAGAGASAAAAAKH
jgi:alkyldihydroxyacetonephosphate synthase